MSRALLDVNVLLALFDPGHLHHRRAHEWITEGFDDGWSSCAITQNGFLRIISRPRYPNRVSPAQAHEVLSRACTTDLHEFWSCSISLLDEHIVDPSRLHGPRQVTDAYVLALAVEHDGRLITFDRSLPVSAVRGGTKDHIVLL